MRNQRTRFILVAGGVLAAAAISASPVSAASDRSACVGQFSSFFASQGIRDDRAREFVEEDHPAGRNVYSHVAGLHGSLQECIVQTTP